MRITKYEHACLVLEEQGKKLVIDPGMFTDEFGALDNIVSVVITHVHSDHFDVSNLKIIKNANADVKIFTTNEAAEKWKDNSVVPVKSGDQKHVGPFTMQFFGEYHIKIHDMKPVVTNVSVMINNKLYYPGDSLTLPNIPVRALAMPSNAPWFKMSEAIEYLKVVKPRLFFRTHDGLLSANGKDAYDAWFKTTAQEFDLSFTPLEPGESIEI